MAIPMFCDRTVADIYRHQQITAMLLEAVNLSSVHGWHPKLGWSVCDI
jgi:hypothetical protein